MKKAILIVLVLVVTVVGFIFNKNKIKEKNNEVESNPTLIQDELGFKWTGEIISFKDRCIVDGVCSVNVGGLEIVLNSGDMLNRPNTQIGKIIGAESITDVANYIGNSANVYVGKSEEGQYTLYGNSNFYVEIVK